MPEVLFVFGGLDGIKDMYGHPLVLLGYDTIVSGGLQGLKVFSLEHHLELLPVLLTGVFSLGFNIKDFEEVHCLGIKGFHS